MDRKLLWITTLTLFAQGFWLLADLQIIPIAGWRSTSHSSQLTEIGKVVNVRENLRRRGLHESYWHESLDHETLYSHDTLLTLSKSYAEIELKNDVKINLHENTLVVLDPPRDDLREEWRLRFHRGDLRTHNPSQKIAIDADQWEVTAPSGTDLKVRSDEEGNLHLDVTEGEVFVSNHTTGKALRVDASERVTLKESGSTIVQKVSPDLAFSHSHTYRVYTRHHSPPIALTWRGEGDQLTWTPPRRAAQTLPLAPQQSEMMLNLPLGTHQFQLSKGDLISRPLTVHVLKAPEIIHLNPLPRDRVTTGQSILFSWLSDLTGVSYRIAFFEDEKLTSLHESHSCSSSPCPITLSDTGTFYWKVFVQDELGFEGDGAWAYPILSHPNPFAPPQMREPAHEPLPTTEDSQKGAWLTLEKLLSWILPQAHGAETQLKSPSSPPVVLNWEKIPGASHYVVEISPFPHFRELDFVAKVSNNYLVWSTFKKKVYYYRVAAGSDTRIGIFSQAQKLDLRNWPPPQAPTSSSAKPAPPAPLRPPSPTPVTKPPLPPKSAPAPAPAPAQSPSTDHPPQLEGRWPDRPEQLLTFWSPGYISTQVSEDDLKVRAQGVQGLNLSLLYDQYVDQTWHRLMVEVGFVEWQSPNARQYPFQTSLSGWQGSLRSHWNLPKLPVAFGFGQQLFFARQSLESLRIDPELYLDVGSFWLLPSVNHELMLGGGVRFHEGRQGLYLEGLSHFFLFKKTIALQPKIQIYVPVSGPKHQSVQFNWGVGWSW